MLTKRSKAFALCSGLERAEHCFGNTLAKLKPICNDTQGEGDSGAHGGFTGLAVGEHARDIWDLCDPPSVFLAVELDSQHEGSVAHPEDTGVSPP